MQLIQAKLKDIHIVDNLSRANLEHEPEEVKRLAEQIIKNDFWDPPHVVKGRRGNLELADGHMRYQAAVYLDSEGRLPKVAGDKNGVWVLVFQKTEAARDALNAASTIIKKTQSSYERAHTLLELQNRHGQTNKDLAEAYGLDAKSVANNIRAAKNLIKRIQLAWLNFEKSDTPIGLKQLLAWAALSPEEQETEFFASQWGRIYSMADRIERNHARQTKNTLRSRHDIETAISNSANLYHIEALEWVLRKRENLDGEYGSSGDNGRSSKRRKGTADNGTSPAAPGANGSGSAPSGNRASMRPNEKRGLDSASDSAKGADESGLSADEENA